MLDVYMHNFMHYYTSNLSSPHSVCQVGDAMETLDLEMDIYDPRGSVFFDTEIVYLPGPIMYDGE